MNIYFFSERTPDPKVVNELGGSITTQFKGTISDIHRIDNQMTFTETLFIGGQTIKSSHTIPAASIVVVEGSLLLQEAWLKAGVATLLIPQMIQETDSWEKHSFKYDRLIQVHRIEVVTSEWNSTNPTRGEKVEEQANLPTAWLRRIREYTAQGHKLRF